MRGASSIGTKVLQQKLKNLFWRLGIDVRRTKNVPTTTFLGLRELPIDCILDVGANIGQFARYARTCFPRSRIYCFEPLPSAASELKRWATERADKNIAVHETALGERAGMAVMIEHLDHSPSSSFLRNTPRADQLYPQTVRNIERQVEVDTLDGWVVRHKVVIDSNSLLKVDVQGLETQVLRGGREVLRRLGICIVEVTPIPLYEGQSTFAEITELLATGGLQYLGNLEQFHDANGLPIYMDAVFMRPSVLG